MLAGINLCRNGRVKCFAVALFSILVVDVPLFADDPPPLPLPPAESKEYTVLRITDENTIVLRDQSGERTVAPAEATVPSDEAARRRLRDFLEQALVGEQILFAALPTPGRDAAHGKKSEIVQGHLYRLPDGLYVNLELVRQGYAAVDEHTAAERLALFRHYEKIARDHRKGIWSPATEPAARESTAPDRAGSSEKAGDGSAGTTKVDLKTITVYITKSGKKYHRANCQHARKNAQPISLQEALEKGYEPCKRCHPPTRENPSP